MKKYWMTKCLERIEESVLPRSGIGLPALDQNAILDLLSIHQKTIPHKNGIMIPSPKEATFDSVVVCSTEEVTCYRTLN